jgi:hypothetical protein
VSGHGDHSDLWSYIGGLREDLGQAEERIRGLHEEFIQAVHRIGRLEDRCASLEKQTPSALQAERELAETLADNAGWDRRGRECNCPYCTTDDDEEPEESPLARRDACIGTWSGQDVTRRAEQ